MGVDEPGLPTLHDWAGGAEAVRRMIDAFYDRVEADELLSAFFPGGVSEHHRAHVADWCILVTRSDPDSERILAAMAEDAEWQLWMPGGPVLRGREAIGKDIERQLRFCNRMKCGLVSITSSDTPLRACTPLS